MSKQVMVKKLLYFQLKSDLFKASAAAVELITVEIFSGFDLETFVFSHCN